MSPAATSPVFGDRPGRDSTPPAPHAPTTGGPRANTGEFQDRRFQTPARQDCSGTGKPPPAGSATGRTQRRVGRRKDAPRGVGGGDPPRNPEVPRRPPEVPPQPSAPAARPASARRAAHCPPPHAPEFAPRASLPSETGDWGPAAGRTGAERRADSSPKPAGPHVRPRGPPRPDPDSGGAGGGAHGRSPYGSRLFPRGVRLTRAGAKRTFSRRRMRSAGASAPTAHCCRDAASPSKPISPGPPALAPGHSRPARRVLPIPAAPKPACPWLFPAPKLLCCPPPRRPRAQP